MGLRQALFGLGLSGIISSSAIAQEPDTGYANMTHAQTHKMLLDRATRVSYDSWDREVLQYDGAVLVLFNSSCNQTPEAENLERNKEIEISELADKYKEQKVNQLPIKFTTYDMCGKSKAEEFIVRGFSLQTQMYLDGKLIDTRIGAPTDIKKVPNAITAGSLWIDTNLLDIPYIKEGEEFRVVYNGTIGASFIPFSQN